MSKTFENKGETGALGLRRCLRWPQVLALLAAAILAAHWLGPAAPLIALPLALLAVPATGGRRCRRSRRGAAPCEGMRLMRKRLDDTLARARRAGLGTGCLILGLDDYDGLAARHGPTMADRVTAAQLDRLAGVLRRPDRLFALGSGRIGLLLAPSPGLCSDRILDLAGRLQSILQEPLLIDGITLQIPVCIGLGIDDGMRPRRSGKAMAEAAVSALDDARRLGPGTIRGAAQDRRACPRQSPGDAEDLDGALCGGQIVSWFQPQISTDTGRVSGFEALVRWHHPEAGLIEPAGLLPLLASSGLMTRLGDVMVGQALDAMRTWQGLGHDIPHVGINFSPPELRDPALADKIAQALDRHDLAPARLIIEIRETAVAASRDEMITRNITALARLGCLIDLDDFGMGDASVETIRRLSVNRLKIDRMVINGIDRAPDQQRHVAAMLSLADRLGLDTIAAGVETAGEHAMLAQLGCGHVQGFGIGPPMPLVETPNWIADHHARVPRPLQIDRQTGSEL